MVAIPLVIGLLALVGLALTVRLGQPPLPPEQRAVQRRKRQVLAGAAVAGIVGFVVLVGVTGGTKDDRNCVGTAIKDPTC